MHDMPTPLISQVTKMASFFIAMLLLFAYCDCKELSVGGDDGWATPAKNDQFYNDWASNNRFQVNDTLRFEYKKDSVMAVGEDEYDRCLSSHPMFFANNGDTVFTLDRPGLFYFISGVAGHCRKGLKMVVKVLVVSPPPHSSAAAAATTPFLILGFLLHAFLLLLLL